MSAKIKLSSEVQKAIVADLEAGMSIIALAKRYGLGATTITRKLAKEGIYTATPRQYQILEGKQFEIEQLYTNGLSMREIGIEYNVSTNVIKTYFKKYNLESRKKRSNLRGRESEIIQAVKEGASLNEIASHFKVCKAKTVIPILAKHGIDRLDYLDVFLTRQRTKPKKPYPAKYTVNSSVLDKIDTEAKAYFLGFFYADGYNDQKKGSVSIELNIKDKSILESFSILFETNKPLYMAPNKDSVRFRIHNRKLSNRLVDLGCMQAKSFKITFPEWVDEGLLPHFVRGYFDGDGCVYSKGNAVKIGIIGSNAFCTKLSEMLHVRCQVNARTFPVLISKGISTTSISGAQQCKRVIGFMYDKATLFLERKKVVADQVLRLPYKRMLNPVEVAEIKRLCANGVPKSKIANDFGVSNSLITMIATGKRGKRLLI